MTGTQNFGEETERRDLVSDAIKDIAEIRKEKGLTREGLNAIRDRLIVLAERSDIFAATGFQPPEDPIYQKIRFYELAHDPDPDTGYVLYVSVNEPGKSFPPHNHHSWAVIVGIEGVEENRIYKRVDEADRSYVEQSDSVVIQPGVGAALMPEDIHSIHVPDDFTGKRCIQFRMYQRPISEQSSREIFAIGKDGKVPTLGESKPPLDVVELH